MSIHVYMGMSLPHGEACKILKAEYHPPVRRGDLHQGCPTTPRWWG